MQTTQVRAEETAWGPLLREFEVIAGIRQVETSSHGGLDLTEEQWNQLPDCLKAYSGRWWEENCDWALPVTFFLLRQQSIRDADFYVFKRALRTAMDYNPEQPEGILAAVKAYPVDGLTEYKCEVVAGMEVGLDETNSCGYRCAAHTQCTAAEREIARQRKADDERRFRLAIEMSTIRNLESVWEETDVVFCGDTGSAAIPITNINVSHDDDCPSLSGGHCNCDVDISEMEVF